MRRIFACCFFLALFSVCAAAQSLDDTDRRILDAIDTNFDDQLTFLERTVNQNSGTRNPQGVRAVGDMMKAPFEALGFETEWIDMPPAMQRAGHFKATRRIGEGPHILLIGHLDTVFEPSSPFQTFEREGNTAKGPGVNDMKGGNAVILYAIKALAQADALGAGTITVFFSGDEESVGAPIEVARRDLIAAGKAADIALCFEGGNAEWAVIGRRGSSRWTLTVEGKQSHSSIIFSDEAGAGAVFEAARILNRFYGEVRGPFGLTFNPGVFAGGTEVGQGATYADQTAYGKTNVVAKSAVVHGGLRFLNEEQKESARALMAGIVEDSLPLTKGEILFEDRYPAMEETAANKALLGRLNAVHARLGIPPAKSFPPERRGAADISFVAPYVTSMDGLGVDGSGAHSTREDMDIESMRFATRRAALFLYDLLHKEE